MNATVEYNGAGEPEWVQVLHSLTVYSYRMHGSTAVPSIDDTPEVVSDYVESLPFVQAVER